MHYEWENPSLQHKNRLDGRSAFTGYDSLEKALQFDLDRNLCSLSLNGSWDFMLAPSPLITPKGWTASGFEPDAGWTKMTVPGCWQMNGFGDPVYSASPYMFVTDPPYVDTDNDTGCYRRTFILPDEMAGQKVTIRFDGVSSMFYLFINGQEVGMSKGAHLPAEFDITDHVKLGENLICVKVLRYSDGSYLESQDMCLMSGIFRDVTVLCWPKDGWVRDVYIRADACGCLKADVTAEGGSKVTATLYDGCKAIAQAKNEIIMQIENAHLWSAEDPYLYTLVLECAGQYIPFRVGFRTVEIKDRQLFINGMSIKAKGINHHDTNTDLGWAVSHEALETDILMMKRHNINFIRTSHYPSAPYFYDLCDKYGIYVLDEADIECHGMGIIDVNILSASKEWEYAYVNRGTRMVYRDRNRACVVIWSMGNESGFGENFRSLSKGIRALDDRPIHYAGAKDLPALIPEEVEKDPALMYQMREAKMKQCWDPCVDMGSTMYMTPEMLAKEGEKDEDLPFLICEYAHSMGNGPGSLKEYWEVMYKYPRLIGGCVWEWQDHSIRKFTPDGKQYFAGGYELNMPYKRDGINGNFCNSGILSPDKVPHPGLLELKKAIQPLYIELESEDPLKVRITSRYQFLTGETRGHWQLVKNGTVLDEGYLCIDDLKPTETRIYDIPAEASEEECFLNLSFCLKKATLWADAGHEVASEQFTLGKAVPAPAPIHVSPLTANRCGFDYTVAGNNFALRFDLLHGYLTEWYHAGENKLAMPLKQNYWRAPTDNDVGIDGPARLTAVNLWKDNGLDRLVPRNLEEPEIKEEPDKVNLTFLQSWGANPFPPVLNVKMTYTVYSDGTLDVSASYKQLDSPYMKENFWWPRLGFTMGLTQKHDRILWHGRGPGENYSDRCCAYPIGWYKKKVTEMHTSYSRMQENGARTDNRWMQAVDRRGHGLVVTALSDFFTFTAHNYTDAALTEAWHEYQLKKADCTVLDIDLVQSGLGSNSCGPEPQTKYKPVLVNEPVSFTFRLKMM